MSWIVPILARVAPFHGQKCTAQSCQCPLSAMMILLLHVHRLTSYRIRGSYFEKVRVSTNDSINISMVDMSSFPLEADFLQFLREGVTTASLYRLLPSLVCSVNVCGRSKVILYKPTVCPYETLVSMCERMSERARGIFQFSPLATRRTGRRKPVHDSESDLNVLCTLTK